MMNTRCCLYSLVAVLLLAVAGCQKSTPTAQTSEPLLPADTSPDPPNLQGITSGQAETYARDLSLAMMSGDVAMVRRLIDWGGMIDRSLDGFEIDEKVRSGFRQGALQSVDRLVNVIHSQTADGGSYLFVRTVRRGDRRHVIMRLVSNEGAMNYHDLRLQSLNGGIVGDRLFVALTGELFSDSLRATAAQGLTSGQSFVSRLTGQAKRDLETLNQTREMSLAVQAGQSPRALQIYDSLPEQAQQTKLVSLHRVMALASLDESQYIAAIDDYSNRFPGDATLGLITLDAAYLRKDIGLLMKSYDSIQRWSGGDPLLALMVASIRAQFGEVDAAIEMSRGVNVEALQLVDAHDYALGLALVAQDHDRALNELRTLRDNHGYVFADLSTIKGYEAFAASPHYQQFLADSVRR
jgi:hypothetical protein